MKRRTFLKRIGVAGAVGSLAGCPGDESGGQQTYDVPTEDPAGAPENESAEETDAANQEETSTEAGIPAEYRDRFEDVVNVTSAGADSGGETPINSVLESATARDTLLYFPPGRYRLDGPWRRESFQNIGFYGPEATLVPPEGHAGNMFILGGGDPASGAVFDGFTVDVTAANTGPRAIQAMVADDLLVRDLTVTGVQDTDQGLSRFDVTDADGSARIERMRMEDGGEPGTLATGCLVGPRSEGTVTFVDCRIAGFPDNGLYGSPAPGPVEVLGGRYANNGIANVRVSGESVVRDVTIVCDEAREGINNMRGIRLREGSGALVENCEIELSTVTNSDGAIALSTGMGSATIRETTIRVDADDVAAIRAKPPSDANGSAVALECEAVTITGSAANGRSVHVVDRDESTFDDLCVAQTGQNRDGLYFLQSQDSLVRNSSVSVTGEPVVAEESTVTTDGLETGTDSGCETSEQ